MYVLVYCLEINKTYVYKAFIGANTKYRKASNSAVIREVGLVAGMAGFQFRWTFDVFGSKNCIVETFNF